MYQIYHHSLLLGELSSVLGELSPVIQHCFEYKAFFIVCISLYLFVLPALTLHHVAAQAIVILSVKIKSDSLQVQSPVEEVCVTVPLLQS